MQQAAGELHKARLIAMGDEALMQGFALMGFGTWPDAGGEGLEALVGRLVTGFDPRAEEAVVAGGAAVGTPRRRRGGRVRAAPGAGKVAVTTTGSCGESQDTYQQRNRRWRGHGRIDIREAFAKSSNVYFYKLGNKLGIDKIIKGETTISEVERAVAG